MRSNGLKFLIIFEAWFITAVFVGASGLFAFVSPLFPQIILFALVLILLFFWQFSDDFRRWLSELNVNWLIGFHLTRLIGFYFLALYTGGNLPFSFAVPAGLGEITVAFASAVLLFMKEEIPEPLLVSWNIAGLVDILVVILAAAKSAMANPDSIKPIFSLPLSLLPTFIAPVIIFTHMVIFARLRAERKTVSSDLHLSRDYS